MSSTKITNSLPVIWDPDSEGNTSKVIATSSREVTAFKLITAEAGSGLVFLYDSATANATDLRWVMDAAADNADAQVFSSPLVFSKGIYAVLEQGANQRVILSVAVIKYTV